jgi:FtsP/CotA-like multicopper oxidase with cupredoxin domain
MLPALALVTLLALATVLGIAWWNSRLPGTFDAMAYATVDYGGGQPISHAGHAGTRVDQLKGPLDIAPAVRTTLIAQEDDGRWTFNRQVPGPEIRVPQGGIVRITLVNKDIDDGVTIHWHGVDVPNGEDGVAGVTQDAVMPGERYTYTFRAEQLGTFWYHSHQVSSRQVRRGLYGAFVIVPPNTKTTGVDRTLIVHDFDGRTALNDAVGLQRQRVEPGTPVRLRLVNSNSSQERLTVTGTRFRVVAIDGTDLNGPTPIENQALQVGGGARYDVAFVMPEGAVRVGVVGSDTALSLSPDGATDAEAPQELPDLDPATYGAPKPTMLDGARFDRSFVLKIQKKFGFFNGRPGRHWAINGEIFPHTPMFVVQERDLVKVRIENHTNAVHPMHLHGHHVLVLSRNGTRTSGSPWWVDTLNVLPDEEYEVAFRADNPGIWMDHCHNLPHARDGLTMHLMYEGVSTPFRIGGSVENHPE